MKRSLAPLAALLALALVGGTADCGGESVTPMPTSEATSSPSVEPTKLRLVTTSPTDTTGGRFDSYFAELVEEYTDGRVTVEIYPGSQLFPATEMWESMISGTVDIFADATYWLIDYVPDMVAFYTSGLWESYEHAYAALESSELPQLLAQKVEEAAPVKMLGIMPAGTILCFLNSARETKRFKDLDGLRTQSSPGAPPPALYGYAGTAAVPISFEESTVAFAQGIIDAVHYPPFTITDFKMYDFGEHALCYTALFFTSAIVVNGDSWEGIPADVRDIIINQVMPEAYEFHKVIHRESEEAALELIEQNVETMHWVAPEDFEGFIAYSQTHPTHIVQTLMVDPEIMDAIEQVRPSKQ